LEFYAKNVLFETKRTNVCALPVTELAACCAAHCHHLLAALKNTAAVRHFRRAPDVTLVHAVGMFPHTTTEIFLGSARHYEVEESCWECDVY
jgi:hypothetical protein